MSSNAERAATLLRALQAAAGRDGETIRSLCTDDLATWTATLSTSSLDELLTELDRRDRAFSDLELEARPLDVGGGAACAEWTLAMTHTGPIEMAEGTVDPTGARVTVNGITVAEFRDDRICSLRQYWDEVDLVDQLPLPPAPAGPSEVVG